MSVTEQRNRLLRSSVYLLTAFFLAGTLVLAGCDGGAVTDDCPPVRDVNAFRNDQASSVREGLLLTPRVIPILWDSFGVALDAELSGGRTAVSKDDNSTLWELSGTGESALLGAVDVTLRHRAHPSSNAITDGHFTLEAEDGDVVSGWYEGTRTKTASGFTMLAKAKVTGGHVGCTLPASESGWAAISGSVTEGQFEYAFDGWLFHHREKNEE